jgi:OmpR family two-component system sensor histidine kinase YxdK
MRLFVRDQLPVIGYAIIQLGIVLLVFWLDGYKHLLTALYAAFLSLSLLSVYLAFRYFSHRALYARLSNPLASLKEFVHKRESAPLPSALDQLMDTQYRHYQNQLKSWERKQQEHITFMNQWVHQMKTPVSVIELITQDEDDSRLVSISEEMDQLKRGLEMVLYIARLETLEQDFVVEAAALRDIVSEVIHDNKRFFIRSYVYPHNRVGPGITVRTDIKWLRFCLQQIVSNAIKYSAGSRKQVSVSAFVQEQAIILEIRDEGIGIPRTDVPRVFTRFFTGENGRAYKESTGMGLYLVKEVLTRLNHQVELESEVGKGTIVRIVFTNQGKLLNDE